MDPTLVKAYKIIFKRDPEPNLKDWQLSLQILSKWNVPELGEDLAKECIFRMVNHVEYPSEATTRSIVHEAELKGTELFPEIGIHDPEMGVYEWLERKYWEKKREGKGEQKIK